MQCANHLGLVFALVMGLTLAPSRATAELSDFAGKSSGPMRIIFEDGSTISGAIKIDTVVSSNGETAKMRFSGKIFIPDSVVLSGTYVFKKQRRLHATSIIPGFAAGGPVNGRYRVSGSKIPFKLKTPATAANQARFNGTITATEKRVLIKGQLFQDNGTNPQIRIITRR